MRLDSTFFEKDALTVAEQLLGNHLVRSIDGHKIVTKIVETEAYCGSEDKGCHAFNNKRTKRTDPMFLPGGHAYIYLIYGMYHCLNVVTGKKDDPHAVLIRAVEPVEGIELIKKHRAKVKNPYNLTSGPGKLTIALGIDMSLNRYDMVNGNELYIETNSEKKNFSIVSSKRINIDYAEEYRDKLWRKYIRDNPFVSIKIKEGEHL